MPSPAVEIKDGAGAYVSAVDGVDVTPGNTITIHLIDSSANSWSIRCVTTDELNVAATVDASLVIDPLARTATFTAPTAGSTYRFESVVNGGIGPNGKAVSSYSTTFCVYTLTGGGERVIAADETTEGDSTFGWLPRLNSIIRSGGGAGEVNTASNVGGEKEVYKTKVGADLRFRTLKAGTNVTLTQNADDITIAASGGGGSTPTGTGYYRTTAGVMDAAAAREVVVWNDAVLADYTNIRGNFLNPAVMVNTKKGIVNFGHDTAGVPSLGITEDYGVCFGGDMPSVTAKFAGAGGYRGNARGLCSFAYGFSAFADGFGCAAVGKGSVAGSLGLMTGSPNITFTAGANTITRSAGDFTAEGVPLAVGDFVRIRGSALNNTPSGYTGSEPNDEFVAQVTAVTATVATIDSGTHVLVNEGPVGGVTIEWETRYAWASGRQSQSSANGSFAHGQICLVYKGADHGIAMGLNSLVEAGAKRGVAIGNQAHVYQLDGIAIGPACVSDGEAAVAIGYHNNATGDTATALGQGTTADGNASFTCGRSTQATAQSAFASGDQTQATGSYSTATGYLTTASGTASSVFGQGATASRYCEQVHGGFPSAEGPSGAWHRIFLKATSTDGASQNLLLPSAAELALDNSKSYRITVHVLGSRTATAQAIGCETHEILAHASGGTLVIDNDTIVYGPALPAGWAIAITASSLVLRVSCNGAGGQTVKFAARVEWTELEGV